MTSNAPTLRIYLLGRFAVEREGQPIPKTAWKKKRPTELLTSLARQGCRRLAGTIRLGVSKTNTEE